MTTGTAIPMDRGLLLDVFMALPAHARNDASLAAMSDRLMETIYRTAIQTGMMEQVTYA